MNSAFNSGYREALAVMGAEKLANPVARWLVRKAPAFLHDVRTNIFGQPLRAYRELRAGRLFGKGGVGLHGLSAPTPWSKALLYGIPAGVGAYTLAGNDPDKYEQIGGLAAGTVLGGAALGPLGMLGMMGGMHAGNVAGRHAGGAVRHLATGEPSQASGPAPRPLHTLPRPFEGPKPYPAVQYGQALGMLGGASGF
jgi:hypothetical protein